MQDGDTPNKACQLFQTQSQEECDSDQRHHSNSTDLIVTDRPTSPHSRTAERKFKQLSLHWPPDKQSN